MIQIAKRPNNAQPLTTGESFASTDCFILLFGKMKNSEITRNGRPSKISPSNTCSAQLAADILNMPVNESSSSFESVW